MDDAVYWIWLQELLGIGSPLVDKVLEHFETAKQIFEMLPDTTEITGIFPGELVERMKNTPLEHAQRVAGRARKLGCQIVTPNHPDYPLSFAHIFCKPCVLYVLGNLCSKAPISITVVGTRKSTEDGRRAAKEICRDLASMGCQIVSGLAKGIDQIAHESTLAVCGRTVGGMACGINVPYPGDSGPLKRRIVDEGGALFSEFPFDCEPFPQNFHIRNRLLSGLSRGTLVVQAAERSGALITAKYAFDNDRDVFTVPGSIFDDTMAGCNQLLKTYAAPVTCAEDILQVYFDCFPADKFALLEKHSDQVIVKDMPTSTKLALAPAPHPAQPSAVVMTQEQLKEMGLTENACKIYDALENELQNYDVLAEKTGLAAGELASALTELEVFSLIELAPGRRYKR